MFRWEPEGCYRCAESMAIAPFWFSMEHRLIVLTPFWSLADNISLAHLVTFLSIISIVHFIICVSEIKLSQTVSREPEGRYRHSNMSYWEPEGRYCHRHCTGIVPFWFSTKHLWILIAPFWLSHDEIQNLILCCSTRMELMQQKHKYIIKHFFLLSIAITSLT